MVVVLFVVGGGADGGGAGCVVGACVWVGVGAVSATAAAAEAAAALAATCAERIEAARTVDDDGVRAKAGVGASLQLPKVKPLEKGRGSRVRAVEGLGVRGGNPT